MKMAVVKSRAWLTNLLRPHRIKTSTSRRAFIASLGAIAVASFVIDVPNAKASFLPVFNIRDYLLAVDADDTASIQRALAAAAAVGAGQVYFPSDRHTVVSNDVTIPAVTTTHVTLTGDAGFASRIRRTHTYQGSIFSFIGTVTQNCTIVIRDLFFFSDYSTDLTPGAATINLTGPSPQSILIADCQFWDQFISISDTDVQNVWIRGCRVLHSFEALTAVPKFGGNAGFAFQGHVAGVIISDCSIFGQAVFSSQQLTYGIYISGADGIQVSNCPITAQNGVMFDAGGTSIDDVYFVNCVIDNCNQSCVTIRGFNVGGPVYTNIRFSACHLDAGTSWDQANCPSSSIIITGNADSIEFEGCNIGLADRYGVYISGVNSWTGAPKKSILFNGCRVADNNKYNFAAIPGVYINSPGVSFNGGTSGNINGTGHQKFGVGIGANGNGAMVTSNRLAQNETQPTYIDPSAAGYLIANNL